MLTLLKGLECYCPSYIGKKDILIAEDKIFKIIAANELVENCLISKIIYCEGLFAFPGIIDQHVHIIGGGGEEGFMSRIPEIEFHDIIMAGVTTLVGLLGMDGYIRSLKNLLAKARDLQSQGITAFIYTGSYSVPVVTITDSITGDIVLINEVIGTGEIAISDHRSSYPNMDSLLNLTSQTYIGGLIGGKAGVVHIHLGDGKDGLKPLVELLNASDFPIEQFVPTHINRNETLFNEGINYCMSGGNIDITAGETLGVCVPNAIEMLIKKGVNLDRVTVSSDANGNIPNVGVGKIQALYDDIRALIINKKINPEIAFQFVTENVAKGLKLYPKKGVLCEGSDADILITDKNFNINKLFCMGKLLVDNGSVI